MIQDNISKKEDEDISHWFGERQVNPQDKEGFVYDVFKSVAPKYDIMNDLMSLGIHRLWKRKLISMIKASPSQEQILLDVAGGTADVALGFLKKYNQELGGHHKVIVYDINADMLKVGQEKAINSGVFKGIEFVQGNAQELPFEDHSVDFYTISFGLRNVTFIDQALQEAYRVLKPGGRFFCLEFSHLEEGMIKQIYDLYSARVIPKIGEIVAKDSTSYEYLIESIRKFPKQEELKERMEQAGFEHVTYQNWSHGIAALHMGWKF